MNEKRTINMHKLSSQEEKVKKTIRLTFRVFRLEMEEILEKRGLKLIRGLESQREELEFLNANIENAFFRDALPLSR